MVPEIAWRHGSTTPPRSQICCTRIQTSRLTAKEIGRSRQTLPGRCHCQSFLETRRRQPAVLQGRYRFHGHQPPGNTQKAKLVDKVQPVYAPRAKQHIEGPVALGVIIGTDGTIGEISPISGPPDLLLSAIDAVKQWGSCPLSSMGIPSKPQLGST